MSFGRRSGLLVLLGTTMLGAVAGFAAYSMGTAPGGTVITWEQLLPDAAARGEGPAVLTGVVQHDQLRGAQPLAPEDMTLVTTWVGQRVRLPGYAVPLEFDGTKVTSFLLVPYLGACIHVPPPPPNQIVFVKTRAPIEIEEMFDAVYATGTFEADLTSTELAQVGYRIVDATVDYYEPS
jgi:hypothetical protein